MYYSTVQGEEEETEDGRPAWQMMKAFFLCVRLELQTSALAGGGGDGAAE